MGDKETRTSIIPGRVKAWIRGRYWRPVTGAVGALAVTGALTWLILGKPDGGPRLLAGVLLVGGFLVTTSALWGHGRTEKGLSLVSAAVGIVTAFIAIPDDAAPRSAPPVGGEWCPGAREGTYPIVGMTSDWGAAIRTEPRLTAPGRPNGPRRFPGKCEVGFVGYCVGDRVHDHFIGTPDQKWYVLPGNTGVVASAVVLEHGSPTLGMPPRQCPGARPTPTRVTVRKATMRKRPAGPLITVHADAPHAVIVGVLARTAGGAWRKAGWDIKSDNGFAIKGVAPVGWRRSGELLAVACYAAERPSPVVARYSTRASGSRVALTEMPARSDGLDLEEAGFTACRRA